MTNVTSLLKTVKAVEDEATRGTRALEATIECIKQELTVRGPEKPRLYGLFRESADETQPLCRVGSNRVRDICVYYSEQKTGELFVLFFPLYYLSSSFPSSLPLSPCRFPTALIRPCVAGAGRVRKEEDFKSLFSFLFFSFFFL